MKKYILALAAIVLLMSSLVAFGGCDDDSVSPNNDGSVIIWSQQDTGIWVIGSGSVTATPDVAVLTLGVEVQAATVEIAQAQAAADMDRVINELEANGIEEADIKTQYYSIYPVRRWVDDEQILVGYRVTNTITVKIRAIEDTGAIIDDVVRAAGNSIRINSIAFTIDEPEAYYEEVRQRAMEDAENKAQQLAELGDVKLGKPTYIAEGSLYAPVRYDDALLDAAESGNASTTPISPGEMEITLTVQVVYDIN